MKKRRIPLLGLVMLFFVCWSTYGDPQESLDSIKMYLIEQRYSCADQVARKILSDFPQNIEALYMRAAIHQTQILDYESYSSDAEQFIGLADSTFSTLAHVLPMQKGKDSLDCLFFMASVLGGKGVIKAKNGNWTGAIKYALTSAKYFKRIIAADSTYYAAYYGIGVFNYYLSQQLKWLPFFGDKRIEALQQLHKAIRAPFPFNYGARSSLCWIHLERNEPAMADTLTSSVLSTYPDNTLFIRVKMRIDLAQGEYDSALSLASRLVELSSKRDPINWPDMVSGFQVLVCCCEHMDKRKELFDAANKALSLPLPDNVRKITFVKKHLKYIVEMKKKYSDF
jgi:tetratricopeptide (TPR) repeat protein